VISTLERVLFLKSVPLFRTIGGEELAQVAQIVEEAYFPAGETFIRQGDVGDCLYVLIDGEVDVVVDERLHVARVGAKGILGEMAVLTDAPRTASCTAVDDTIALRIDRDDFWELMGQHPAVALGVIKEMSERLEQMHRRLEQQERRGG
jgi:CRP/FNR family cyclic AMP-dependent transcriptional regulator